MTSGVLVQVLFNLILMAAVVFLWVKLHRPQKDDPRLSRGLQLLQSKIAVLEDLSDQVETQVVQITALIESKAKEVQSQILHADKQIQKIEASMGKSLEVAQIFQDRIPHQEIIERQNTMKYVKAARMAHQGMSVAEIAEEVDLSPGEIEMIAKVNREQLQFSEADLPEWAKGEVQIEHPRQDQQGRLPMDVFTNESMNQQGILENQMLVRQSDHAPVALSELGEKFRQVGGPQSLANFSEMDLPPIPGAVSSPSPSFVVNTQTALPSASGLRSVSTGPATRSIPATSKVSSRPEIEMPGQARPAAPQAPVKERAQTTTGKDVEIQKVVFPRLDMTQHLS